MEKQTQNKSITQLKHDMQISMNAIIGLSDLAMNELNNPLILNSYLSTIHSSGKTLLDLINHTLDEN